MSVWLFQANKQEYDLLEKVLPLLGGSDWWSVKQHVDKMKRDDIALFWQSGEDAGIYATGKLISEPYSTSSNATDDHRVNVTYDQLLAVPLLRSTLTDHPVLRNLDVLNRPWGRNAFRVDDAEWSALQSLISEQGV